MLHTITFDLPLVLPHNTDCACCAGHLVEALHGRAGIAAARLDDTRLVLDVDPRIVAATDAEQLALDAGLNITRRYDHPTFVVEGMDCADCARKLERALTRLAGVHYARVNFAAAKLSLEYDREQTSVATISALARQLGYTIRPAQPTNIFTCTVEGMCCAAEAGPIERVVRGLPGVQQVSAEPTLARLTVAYDPQVLAPARIVEKVTRLGFQVAQTTEAQPGQPRAAEPPARRGVRGRTVLTILCGALFLSAWAAGLLGAPEAMASALYILATIVGGSFVARSGWATLRATRSLDINALMTIAASGALLIGEYAEGAAVVFLFALGNALEGYTMERARRSIRALMSLAPATALVRRDGVERELPVGEVAVGETIIVRPGDRIPMDAVVTDGRSAVDQAPITGESMPIEKEVGAEVFAGSINGEGAFEARVTRPAQDSTLARIIHLVEEAQTHKAPTQRFIDIFARYYTPAVLVLALLIAVLPPLLAGGEWATWVYRSLVLLVIACPCALVIATPVSIVSAISAGARNGVLFKGGAALEATGGLRAIAFDKTGTLTVGRPVVTDVVVFENDQPASGDWWPAGSFTLADDRARASCGCCAERSTGHNAGADASEIDDRSETDELLRLAAGVERRSSHPLARAIVVAAEARGLSIPLVSNFQSQSGRGASASVTGREVAIGNRAMFGSAPLPPQAEAMLTEIEQAGRTAMLVGYNGVPRGIIAAADQERDESQATVATLRRMGIAHIAMLTGDTARAAARVAASVGVQDTRAELLPQAKLAAIDELLARHGRVGMIGDGVNDAPALARATIGIAMGAAGSDAALETADVTLMADDLTRLPFAIGLSRAARRVIVQNIAFALAVKMIFLAATVLGVATLWMAVFADTGAALIVIANGMRLLGYRERRGV